MKAEEILNDTFRQIFADYGDDFDCDIEYEDTFEDISAGKYYFAVCINHYWGDLHWDIDLTCRVVDGEPEFCRYEDVYSPLTGLELWQWIALTLIGDASVDRRDDQ